MTSSEQNEQHDVRGLTIQRSHSLEHPTAALLPLFEAFHLHAFDEVP
jgi:hypothetical protein